MMHHPKGVTFTSINNNINNESDRNILHSSNGNNSKNPNITDLNKEKDIFQNKNDLNYNEKLKRNIDQNKSNHINLNTNKTNLNKDRSANYNPLALGDENITGGNSKYAKDESFIQDLEEIFPHKNEKDNGNIKNTNNNKITIKNANLEKELNKPSEMLHSENSLTLDEYKNAKKALFYEMLEELLKKKNGKNVGDLEKGFNFSIYRSKSNSNKIMNKKYFNNLAKQYMQKILHHSNQEQFDKQFLIQQKDSTNEHLTQLTELINKLIPDHEISSETILQLKEINIKNTFLKMNRDGTKDKICITNESMKNNGQLIKNWKELVKNSNNEKELIEIPENILKTSVNQLGPEKKSNGVYDDSNILNDLNLSPIMPLDDNNSSIKKLGMGENFTPSDILSCIKNNFIEKTGSNVQANKGDNEDKKNITSIDLYNNKEHLLMEEKKEELKNKISQNNTVINKIIISPMSYISNHYRNYLDENFVNSSLKNNNLNNINNSKSIDIDINDDLNNFHKRETEFENVKKNNLNKNYNIENQNNMRIIVTDKMLHEHKKYNNQLACTKNIFENEYAMSSPLYDNQVKNEALKKLLSPTPNKSLQINRNNSKNKMKINNSFKLNNPNCYNKNIDSDINLDLLNRNNLNKNLFGKEWDFNGTEINYFSNQNFLNNNNKNNFDESFVSEKNIIDKFNKSFYEYMENKNNEKATDNYRKNYFDKANIEFYNKEKGEKNMLDFNLNAIVDNTKIKEKINEMKDTLGSFNDILTSNLNTSDGKNMKNAINVHNNVNNEIEFTRNEEVLKSQINSNNTLSDEKKNCNGLTPDMIAKRSQKDHFDLNSNEKLEKEASYNSLNFETPRDMICEEFKDKNTEKENKSSLNNFQSKLLLKNIISNENENPLNSKNNLPQTSLYHIKNKINLKVKIPGLSKNMNNNTIPSDGNDNKNNIGSISKIKDHQLKKIDFCQQNDDFTNKMMIETNNKNFENNSNNIQTPYSKSDEFNRKKNNIKSNYQEELKEESNYQENTNLDLNENQENISLNKRKNLESENNLNYNIKTKENPFGKESDNFRDRILNRKTNRNSNDMPDNNFSNNLFNLAISLPQTETISTILLDKSKKTTSEYIDLLVNLNQIDLNNQMEKKIHDLIEKNKEQINPKNLIPDNNLPNKEESLFKKPDDPLKILDLIDAKMKISYGIGNNTKNIKNYSNDNPETFLNDKSHENVLNKTINDISKETNNDNHHNNLEKTIINSENISNENKIINIAENLIENIQKNSDKNIENFKDEEAMTSKNKENQNNANIQSLNSIGNKNSITYINNSKISQSQTHKAINQLTQSRNTVVYKENETQKALPEEINNNSINKNNVLNKISNQELKNKDIHTNIDILSEGNNAKINNLADAVENDQKMNNSKHFTNKDFQNIEAKDDNNEEMKNREKTKIELLAKLKNIREQTKFLENRINNNINTNTSMNNLTGIIANSEIINNNNNYYYNPNSAKFLTPYPFNILGYGMSPDYTLNVPSPYVNLGLFPINYSSSNNSPFNTDTIMALNNATNVSCYNTITNHNLIPTTYDNGNCINNINNNFNAENKSMFNNNKFINNDLINNNQDTNNISNNIIKTNDENKESPDFIEITPNSTDNINSKHKSNFSTANVDAFFLNESLKFCSPINHPSLGLMKNNECLSNKNNLIAATNTDNIGSNIISLKPIDEKGKNFRGYSSKEDHTNTNLNKTIIHGVQSNIDRCNNNEIGKSNNNISQENNVIQIDDSHIKENNHTTKEPEEVQNKDHLVNDMLKKKESFEGNYINIENQFNFANSANSKINSYSTNNLLINSYSNYISNITKYATSSLNYSNLFEQKNSTNTLNYLSLPLSAGYITNSPYKIGNYFNQFNNNQINCDSNQIINNNDIEAMDNKSLGSNLHKLRSDNLLDLLGKEISKEFEMKIVDNNRKFTMEDCQNQSLKNSQSKENKQLSFENKSIQISEKSNAKEIAKNYSENSNNNSEIMKNESLIFNNISSQSQIKNSSTKKNKKVDSSTDDKNCVKNQYSLRKRSNCSNNISKMNENKTRKK